MTGYEGTYKETHKSNHPCKCDN